MATPMAIPIPVNDMGLDETERARALAKRYHSEFVDLKNFKIQHELFKSVPVDMMFRYNFVPLEQSEGRLAIAVSDPSKLMVLDEISGLLGTRLVTRVATLSQITDLLKKTEQSIRFSPAYPNDPADRLIGATAIVHGMRLVTIDKKIRATKEVDCIW